MISHVTQPAADEVGHQGAAQSLPSCGQPARPGATAVTGTRKPSVNSSLRASSSAMKPMLKASPASRWLPVSA